MAITNNGTIVKLPSHQIPSGYVHIAVTEVADHEYKRQETLSILKATVENADPKVTLADILAEAAIGINKQVTDLITADYIGTQTVEVHAELVRISNNQQVGASSFYSAAANAYSCVVNIFVKST